jgi:hypothetical protein
MKEPPRCSPVVAHVAASDGRTLSFPDGRSFSFHDGRTLSFNDDNKGDTRETTTTKCIAASDGLSK